MSKRVIIHVMHEVSDEYRIRVLPADPRLAAGHDDILYCLGAGEATRTIQEQLGQLFVDGDTIQFASILFTSVNDAMTAVRVALRAS